VRHVGTCGRVPGTGIEGRVVKIRNLPWHP
jgi:hypothetical protein